MKLFMILQIAAMSLKVLAGAAPVFCHHRSCLTQKEASCKAKKWSWACTSVQFSQ